MRRSFAIGYSAGKCKSGFCRKPLSLFCPLAKSLLRSILFLGYYLFAVIITAIGANSVRKLGLVALGAYG